MRDHLAPTFSLRETPPQAQPGVHPEKASAAVTTSGQLGGTMTTRKGRIGRNIVAEMLSEQTLEERKSGVLPRDPETSERLSPAA